MFLPILCLKNKKKFVVPKQNLPYDVTRSSLEREAKGSNIRPAKSETELPMARPRCDISSREAELLGRNNAEMGPATCYTLRRSTARITKI